MNDTHLPSVEAIALVSVSPDAVLLLSAGLTVIAAREAALQAFGANRDDVVRHNLRQALAGSDSLDALVASANAMRTGQLHTWHPDCSGRRPIGING